MLAQGRSKRQPSGALYKPQRNKKKYEMGRETLHTKLGEARSKKIRVKGGNSKVRILATQTANVLDPKTGKISIVKIKTVSGNTADSHFVRRNIITKGAVVTTEIGKAIVTSRPGQDGVVNAVLVKDQAK